MKKYLAIILFICTQPLFAQEAISLTTPIVRTSIANYTPGELRITLVPTPSIYVTIIGTDAQPKYFMYPCATPCAMDTEAKVLVMISTLNTANLATRSLWRRVFDRLLLDFPTQFVGGATVQ